MDYDDSLKKAVSAQQAQDKLRRQAQGERTGLQDTRKRADPTQRQRTPEPKVSKSEIAHPTATPDWVSQIRPERFSPHTYSRIRPNSTQHSRQPISIA